MPNIDLDNIDLNTTTENDDELKRIAEHECAHAIAYEVREMGVRRVRVEPNATAGRCYPHWTSRPTVCTLAGPAWDVRRGDPVMEDEVQTMLSGGEPVISDFQRAIRQAEDQGELDEAWAEAQEFVEDWSSVIKHAASSLMCNYRQFDEPELEGVAIREFVRDPSAFGLETPWSGSMPSPVEVHEHKGAIPPAPYEWSQSRAIPKA